MTSKEFQDAVAAMPETPEASTAPVDRLVAENDLHPSVAQTTIEEQLSAEERINEVIGPA